MFGFQIGKWFWNLWDNLLPIILLNLLSLGLWTVSFFLLQFFVTRGVLLFGTVCLVILFLVITLQHVYALVNYSIAKFSCSNWRDSLRRAWQKPSLCAALLFELLLLLGGFIYFVSWRFYSQQSGFLSLLALGILFWLALFFLLCFGFYFPLLVREQFSFRKAVRQGFIVCLDNPVFAVVLGLIALFLSAASLLPPLLLLLGPVGLGLWYEVSLRLLYYKYQYLEQLTAQNLPAGRRQKIAIPWRILLREERQNLGPRSWRNFIFPWKD